MSHMQHDWTDLGGVSFRRVRGDRLGLIEEAKQRGGDYAVGRAGPARIHLLSDPAGIEHVLVRNQRNYIRGEPEGSPLMRSLGRGLLLADGPFHLRQRRLIQPAFSLARIADYSHAVRDALDGLRKEWHALEGSVVDVHEEMMRLTMVVIGRVLFDVDLTRESRALGDAITELNSLAVELGFSVTGWLPWLPTPRNRRLARATHEVRRAIDAIIEERRRSGIDKGDLLSLLLAAQDEELAADDPSGRMDAEQVRNESLLLFAAGHETTANMLTWTWYLLARTPEVEERLHAELDEVLAGRPPSLEDLASLPYLDQVLKESMRLYPPAWINMRRSLEEDVIEGRRIAGDSVLLMAPYLVHRDPRWFPEPELFDPDRFRPAGRQATDEPNRPRFAYFPFGGGVRQCVGQAFAEMEGRLALAMLAQHVTPRLLPEQRVEPEAMITLRPRGGLPMRLMPR